MEQWLAEQLAVLLRMRERDDQHLVSAAMSFKQKVDLVIELYPKRAQRNPRLPEIDMGDVRKALYAAEEYRNRVVHSFYAIECGEPSRWMRMKGSLKGRAGFSLNSVATNVHIFEECNEALRVIRGWMMIPPAGLRAATATLTGHMQGGSL